MTTITKERIELFIKNPLENGLARGEQMELAQIALASLAAEPVAWKATFTQIDHEYNTFTAMYSDKAEVERWVRLHKVGDFRAKITPLYASSPALVVPDKLPREYIRGWPLAYSDYAEGWNACRAAMLQSGNFRENKNSSTNNFREIAETSTNSPLIPGEVLSAIREVAKIRADFDDFDGDRRGIGDCLDEAEQELIVTINKYASQLAVEPVVPAVLERLRTIVADPRALPRRKEWVSGQQYSYVLLENVEAMVDEACHAASRMQQPDGWEAVAVAWKVTFTQVDHESNTFTAIYFDKAEVEYWVRLHKACGFRVGITPLYAAPPVPDKLPRE